MSNRGRNFILQLADLMIQRVINGLIILMLNVSSSNYRDLPRVKVRAVLLFQLSSLGLNGTNKLLRFCHPGQAQRVRGAGGSPGVLISLPVFCACDPRTQGRRNFLLPWAGPPPTHALRCCVLSFARIYFGLRGRVPFVEDAAVLLREARLFQYKLSCERCGFPV